MNTPVSVRQFIEQENAQHQVVVWSKSYCPYCTSAKNLLQNTVSPPPTDIKIYELDRMSNGAAIQDELYNMTRQQTVPNVFIKNQHVGGNDDCQHLYRTGQLKELLLS
jgi:glutaredoxin 3